MRIVICRTCWSWVPLEADQCPECHHAVDINEADPSPMQLEELLGTITNRLGTVRCERKQLPSVGLFLATTEGLLFLPELIPLPNGALEAVEQPAEPFWSLPRWWFGRRSDASRSLLSDRDTEVVPRQCPGHSEVTGTLSARFIESPGAVFVPQQHLIRAALRGRTWTISRSTGRTIRFTAISNPEEARRAWREMLNRDPWRALTA